MLISEVLCLENLKGSLWWGGFLIKIIRQQLYFENLANIRKHAKIYSVSLNESSKRKRAQYLLSIYGIWKNYKPWETIDKVRGVARGGGGGGRLSPYGEKLYHALEKNRGKLRDKEKNQEKRRKFRGVREKIKKSTKKRFKF